MLKRATLVATLGCGFCVPTGLVMVAMSGAQAATQIKTPATKKRALRAADKAAGAQGASDGAESALAAGAAPEPGHESERTSAASFVWTARPDAVDMDARADSKRAEAVAKLKRILATLPEGPQKAELMFRLSEMYWAKSRYMHLRAMQAWDARLQQWNQDRNRGKEPVVQDEPDYGEAKRYRGETIHLYEKILADYPAYERKDEVLYNFGSSLYDAGDKKSGVAQYWRLLKQFPESDFAPDAWLQLGEHFFNANKLTQAIKAYANAAATKKPRIYSYALYKLAWCDYNLQEYKNALDKFRQVVDYARKAQAAGQNADSGQASVLASGDRIQLMEEAYADMVRAYSHLDAVDDAVEYYDREVGTEKAYRYLHRLAKLYNEEGKSELEIKMFERLNDSYPYRPEAPRNQTAVMAAYAHLGERDMVRKEARRLIELYSPNGVWAQHNGGNESVLDDAFEAVEQELAAVVTEQHRAAQETKLVETYQLARDLYKEYLDKFADSVNSYAFRFYYAEILYGLKQYEEAADQYSLVVQSDAKGKFVKHAAYTAILSWEKVVGGVKETVGTRMVEQQGSKEKGALKQLERIETLKKGERYEPTELSAAEQKLADVCDRFVEVAPADDEVVKVKFKSARLYYIHHHFEEAATRFGEIIDRWPDDGLARVGAESIVQSFNVREDWAQLNHWSRKFRDDKRLMADAKFKATIDEFVEGASFNEIHFVYEAKGDAADTADRYAAFAKEFPQSKYVLVALYDAVVNYDKANRLEKAIEQATIVLGAYRPFTISEADLKKSEKEGGTQLPKPEEIREKVLFLQASFFERLAHFDQAADLYEAYAKEFASGPRRADAIYNAAVFREGLGNYAGAVLNFAAYIKEFPDKPDVKELSWRIGSILEKGRDWRGAMQHYEAWAKQHGAADPARKLCADFRVIEASAALGQLRDAAAAYPRIVAAYAKLNGDERQTPCALEAGAKANFELLEPAFRAYMELSLKGNEKQVAANLTKKLRDVEELQKSYTGVLALGNGDYGIASLYRIGQIYRDLAEDIFSSACPKRLDEDQCGIYQAMLQEKAFPLEEKAIEAFDKALAKAYELGLYNEWLGKTQEALATYEAGRFPEVHAYDLIASEAATEIPELVEAYR